MFSYYEPDRRAIKDSLGFRKMETGSIYLVNSLIFGRNKSKEFFKLKEQV